MIEAAATEVRASPYKGLTNYTERDADYFFGRYRDTEVIVSNLKARRLTLLYGESGVGKTSLLRAGVVASLRHSARQDVAELSVDGSPMAEYLPVAFSAWGGNPTTGLAEAIQSAVREMMRDPEFELPQTRHVDEMIDAAANRAQGYLLIVLDQFEEYFLYHGNEEGEGTFGEDLVRAVKSPDLRASFLISIREDALAKLDRFKRDIPKLFDYSYRVTHLTKAAAREAITEPVRTYNAQTEGQPWEIPSDDVVGEVLRQVEAGQIRLELSGHGTVDSVDGKPGESDEIEAPYLQLVMERLWEKEQELGSHELRLSTLTQELGGAATIVKTHLDDELGHLSPQERRVAADVFHYLVTPSGTKIAHTVPDLARYGEHSTAEIEGLFKKLTARAALIVRPVSVRLGEDGPPRFEIFHDVLAPAILDWRSREIADQKADQVERRVERTEKRRRRRLLVISGIVVAGLGLLLVAAILLASHFHHNQNVAERQRNAAERQKQRAQAELREYRQAELVFSQFWRRVDRGDYAHAYDAFYPGYRKTATRSQWVSGQRASRADIGLDSLTVAPRSHNGDIITLSASLAYRDRLGDFKGQCRFFFGGRGSCVSPTAGTTDPGPCAA